MHEHNLKDREAARRKALWTLTQLKPGDPKAKPVLDVLDDIDHRDDLNATLTTAEEVGNLPGILEVEARADGLQIIRETSIPEPWRERFNQASVGSTRLVDGPYLHDFQKFIAMWKREITHLQAHRTARTLDRQQVNLL
jgi:hypothetical protein